MRPEKNRQEIRFWRRLIEKWEATFPEPPPERMLEALEDAERRLNAAPWRTRAESASRRPIHQMKAMNNLPVAGAPSTEVRRLDYKTAIMELVEDSDRRGLFKKPNQGVMEYPLLLSSGSARADFCYEIGSRGRLFIEDEDAPKALNNLMKYWRWCADHPGMRPVHLIHVIGTDQSIFVDHCRFLRPRIEDDLKANGFRYHIVTLDCHWSDTDLWLPEVWAVLDEISGSSLRSW